MHVCEYINICNNSEIGHAMCATHGLRKYECALFGHLTPVHCLHCVLCFCVSVNARVRERYCVCMLRACAREMCVYIVC